MIAQLARFASVGSLATLIHVGLALIFEGLLGAAPQTANLAGFLAASLVSYAGHQRYSFEAAPQHMVQAPRFAVTALAAFATSAALTQIVTVWLGLPFALAMALVVATVPMMTFIALKYWAFDGQDRAPQTVYIPGIVLPILCAGALLSISWNSQISHDVAWYLIATERWLMGERLYVDLVEVNPPLNFYFTLPAVILSQKTGLDFAQAQLCVTCAIYAASLAWCWRLLPEQLASRPMGFALVAIALSVPFLGGLAQREHTMVLLLAPFAIARLLGHSRGEVGRAAFAAFGICLKPHFVLYPLALTVVDLLRERSLRVIWQPSNLIFLSVGLAYLMGAWAVHPEYFSQIIPIAGLVYGDYGFGAAQVIAPLLTPQMLLTLCLLLALMFRGAAVGLALLLAALAIYVVQWTGYPYQFFPVTSIAILALTGVMLNAASTRLVRSLAVPLIAILTLVPLQRGLHHNPWTEAMAHSLEAHGATGNLASLSTTLAAGPGVALAQDLSWSSRYPALWLVPAVVNSDQPCTAQDTRCAALARLEADTRTAILDDLGEDQPDWLLVDRSHLYIRDPDFSWHRFLSDDPRFAAFMEAYDMVEENAHFALLRRRSVSRQ